MMRDIVIYDKQDVTRIGMETVLLNGGKSGSVFVVADKRQLVKVMMEYPRSLVVLDYVLSDFSSANEVLNVGYRFPESHWLLFSDELSYDFLHQLVINSKSYSFLLKSSDLKEIKLALYHSIKGDQFVCERLKQLLELHKNTADKTEKILTPTEIEILKEIALGKTTKEIGNLRNTSYHTIITHRKNIFRKLEVNNVHEAIKYAARAGIIDLAEYYI